ncbi:hypothetical protein [Nitrosospira sp. Nsp1]|uniref:hypothetical protein n=1 Tax=Nitrosospira sp. Nsp1 TaxID=136547 RepID=UPI00115F8FFC|nr:hypothetical protein [Nitrosospira sp. Nsp1]
MSAIASLVSCAAIGADYISNDDLKQLVKEKPIWCRDLDANGTCGSVMHYGLTEGNSIPVSEYMLIVGLAKHGKLRASFTEVFSESGLCMTFNEAYAEALATFVAANDFARITPDDQPFSEKGQIEFNSKIIEPLRPVFGRNIVGGMKYQDVIPPEKYPKSKPPSLSKACSN